MIPVLAALAAPLLTAGVLPNPTITASSPSSTGAVANLFDDNDTEYRSASGTGNGTFAEFDFGANTTMDGFVNVTRSSTSSVVDACRLIFDTDGIPGFNASTDTVATFSKAGIGQEGQGYINRFSAVTARKVRWEVTGSSGGSLACGAMEMRFLNSAADSSPVQGVAVIGGSPPLDATYLALGNACNGIVGNRPGTTTITPAVAYKSNAQGSDTHLDFDLGQIRDLTGFDWFDNLASTDRVSGFTVTFANDPSFTSPVAVRTISGNPAFAVSDSFAVSARYARYRVTAAAAASVGLSEIVFYEGSGSGLPGGFSAAQNPANGWLHGSKATPQADELFPFDVPAAASAGIPCDRWSDGESEPAFAGIAPANAPAKAWGGAITDWEAGRFYHAWRDDDVFPLVSRFTITKTGAYNLNASWSSHTVGGCAATSWLVVNGSTVASSSVNGFAGTSSGTATPSGIAPVGSVAAYGLALSAGSTVDIVTVPLSSAGNVAITAAVAETTLTAESTATPVIREFCASNKNTLTDGDGDASDWIEIYNGTGVAIDLAGWALTDKQAQPKQWIFPARVLAHGQRLVVFASGKDAAKRPAYGPDSELHTNFSLSKDGEFLGLAQPNGNFVSLFSPAFPKQYDDIAYGAGSNGITGYLAPTPGTPNGTATAVPPAVLAFSELSGIIQSNKSVTISGQAAQHTVRYTTDGSEPTLANGSTYGGAIAITTSTTLRARAFANGVGGPLAAAQYTRLGTTVQYGITPATFAGSLPILVIDAPSAPPSDKTPVVSRFTLIDRAAADGKARLTATPAFSSRGTIKLRGQYSTSFPKKSYTVEFWDEADRDRALEVLGMPAESDWTLYAAYQTDPDFLRNLVMYELYRKMDRWAPRTRLVEVFFNTTAGNNLDAADYYGIYVLREKIKVDGNRVDIAKMTQLDNSGDAITGGYLIAHDKYGNFEQTHPELLTGNRDGIPHWPYTAGGAFIYKTPSVTDITAAQKAYISDYVLQCDTAITSPGFRHPVIGLHYTDYIGRDSFMDHHMLMAFAKNLDGIRISTYFEKDRGGKLKMSSVWDNDLSQDSDTNGADDNPNTWNADMPVSAGYTDYFSVDGHTAEGWFHYLHQDFGYMQGWVDRYDRWRSGGVLDIPAIHAFMDGKAAELISLDNNGTAAADTPVARNFGRWPRTTRGVNTNGSNAAAVIFGSAATSEINRHKTWLAQRLAFMDSWVLRKPAASPPSGPVAAGTRVSLDSPDLTGVAGIHCTLDGSDPVAADGSVAPGALLWSGPLAVNRSVRLIARLRNPSAANKHTAWSAPLSAAYAVGAQPAAAANLGVSELMYHPADPTPQEIAAGFTDAEDFEFIELRNTGSIRLNLWGARFTLGIGFEFDLNLDPASAELEPGETVVLASNTAAFAFRYGSGARLAGNYSGNLANSGEQLVMVDAAGYTILDFAYSDDAPWPSSADGGGASLHYLGGSPGLASSWFALAPGPGAASADADGDGQTDAAEWQAGTDPANPASRFEITAASATAQDGFVMSFPVAAGHTYRIERSADLTVWQLAGAEFTAAQSGTYRFTGIVIAGSPQFYRVVAIARP